MEEERGMENSNQSCGFVINVNSAGNQIAQTINNTYNGNVSMGNAGGVSLPKNDRDIKEAIEELLEATDEKGEHLFKNKKQWYAVYRVLKDVCYYPAQMRAFVMKIKQLEVVGNIDRRGLTYDSLTAASQDVPKLSCNPSAWNAFEKINENYRQQCAVADFLMQKLGYKS